MALVPVSGTALSWAVSESGISKRNLESRLSVPKGTIDSWIKGAGLPNQTQFRRLKLLLRRPAAVFFMDSPPSTAESTVSMRFALGATSRARSPKERHAIRDSLRVRDFVGDLLDELGLNESDIPAASTNENPEDVAKSVRSKYFGVSIDEQMSWASPAMAFGQWRALIERLNILVFLYSLGENSARGFSHATKSPPVIGISTTWHASVRIYTLFHELGHILTRTSSSCVEETAKSPTNDPIERWCESFAASFLMPRQDFEVLAANLQRLDPVSIATRLSNRLFVSRKSALLRMVEIGQAKWDDFRYLKSKFERNQRGGTHDPDQSRTRDIARKHKYGRCLSTVYDAYRAGLVSEADIRTYLRLYPDELR
ncbi:MAG: ImmA/IrrE family metallo-endopeptidase [Gammaproteobacteria bacterium]|nr:ImmA/IrrE family metallo-endopeptidase [Gammaproteobacteria bacterium]